MRIGAKRTQVPDTVIEAKKLCEDKAAMARVEAFARSVVQYERTLRRPASKEEIFKECKVPLEVLDAVVSFVNTPLPVQIEALLPERLQWFEKSALVLLQTGSGRKEFRLVDAVDAIPEIEVADAREVLGYLTEVKSLRLDPDPSWKMDALIRRALDLPKSERNLVDLSRELNIGPYEAKKLEVSLKIFEGGAYRVRTKPPTEHEERPRAHGPSPITAAQAAAPREPKHAPPMPKAAATVEPREAAPQSPLLKEPEAVRDRQKKREDGEDGRDFTRL